MDSGTVSNYLKKKRKTGVHSNKKVNADPLFAKNYT